MQRGGRSTATRTDTHGDPVAASVLDFLPREPQQSHAGSWQPQNSIEGSSSYWN